GNRPAVFVLIRVIRWIRGFSSYLPGVDDRLTVGTGGRIHSAFHSLVGSPGASKSRGKSRFRVVSSWNSQVICSPLGFWNHRRAGSIQRSANFSSLLFFHSTSSAFLNSTRSSFVFGRISMNR